MIDIKKLQSSKYIALDTETCDPNLKTHGPGGVRNDGHLAGISIATDNGLNDYFPVGHQTGNLNARHIQDLLDIILKLNKPLIFANALYDLEWLRSFHSKFKVDQNSRVYDIQVIEPLLDENNRKYSLNNLSKKYLKEEKYEDQINIEVMTRFGKRAKVKESLWKLHPNYVKGYAVEDARLTLEVFKKQMIYVQNEKIEEIVEFESKLIPLLLDMRLKGVRVSSAKAETLYNELKQKQELSQKILNKRASTDINVWANASIKRAYDKENIKYTYTDKGTPSFTQGWLEIQKDPISECVLKIRKLDKIRNTFIKNMIMEKATKGRIHCQFHSTGTVTGRFSSSNPNLQQVPARDQELAPLIRQLFIPEEGEEWVCADYAQQEPRVLVHYASLKNIDSALVAKDNYHQDENTDFHQMVADMAEIPRKQAKTINLALFYGMGQKKLAKELGLDEETAKNLFIKYHSKVPFVRTISNQVSSIASTRGYIKTLLGRKRRFNLWEPADSFGEKAFPYSLATVEYHKQKLKRAFTHKALNALIQGSSADITKAAMYQIYKAGLLKDLNLLLTVHDELDFSVSQDKQKCLDEAIQVMKNCIKLEVPLQVDVERGSSWGTVK
jgi:DNA polymerase I-like protein with 3'-5' exonuclease and polymerase domains